MSIENARKAVLNSAVLQMWAAVLGWTGFLCSFIATLRFKSTYLEPALDKNGNHSGEFTWPDNTEERLNKRVGNTWEWPATVSEMGGDVISPAGRLFFAFELLAGIFFLLAQAPQMLEKAESRQPGWLLRLRSIIPALGLLIVATVAHVAPRDNNHLHYARGDIAFQTYMHCIGAAFLFLGTTILEVLALFVYNATEGRREYVIRAVATGLAAVSAAAFIIVSYVKPGYGSWCVELLAGSCLNFCLFVIGVCAYLRPKHRGPMRIVEEQFGLARSAEVKRLSKDIHGVEV